MNYKKKLLTFCLLPATMMALSACGENPNKPSSSNGGNNQNQKVTVTFWHSMGKTNQELLQTMIKAFNDIYPNIEIKETAAAGGYEDLQTLVLKNVSTHNLPTMAFCYPDHVAQYLESGNGGIVANLDSFINDPEIGFKAEEGSHVDEETGKTLTGVDDYVPSFWEEGCNYQKEGVYSVPFAKSTEALFYNKDVFDQNGWEVPQTWDQMWNLCQIIRETYNEDEIVAPLGYDSDSNLFISLCQQMGIPYTSTTGDHYLFDNPQAKAMVKDLKEKFDKKYFITKGSSGNNTYTSTKFTSGEILMSIGSTGGTQYNGTQNFEVGVAEVPSYDLNSPAIISQGPSICIFNDASKEEQRAAWQFYKFISTAENSTKYAVSTGYQPVRLSSYQTKNYIDFSHETTNLMNKVASLSSSLLNSYFNSPVFVGSATARKEVGSLVSSVLLGSKSVDDAFTQALSNCVNS